MKKEDALWRRKHVLERLGLHTHALRSAWSHDLGHAIAFEVGFLPRHVWMCLHELPVLAERTVLLLSRRSGEATTRPLCTIKTTPMIKRRRDL